MKNTWTHITLSVLAFAIKYINIGMNKTIRGTLLFATSFFGDIVLMVGSFLLVAFLIPSYNTHKYPLVGHCVFASCIFFSSSLFVKMFTQTTYKTAIISLVWPVMIGLFFWPSFSIKLSAMIFVFIAIPIVLISFILGINGRRISPKGHD